MPTGNHPEMIAVWDLFNGLPNEVLANVLNLDNVLGAVDRDIVTEPSIPKSYYYC